MRINGIQSPRASKHFCLTTIIGNLSDLPTSISENSCIVAELVPACSPAKIYHLLYVRREGGGDRALPLIAPTCGLKSYPRVPYMRIKILLKVCIKNLHYTEFRTPARVPGGLGSPAS